MCTHIMIVFTWIIQTEISKCRPKVAPIVSDGAVINMLNSVKSPQKSGKVPGKRTFTGGELRTFGGWNFPTVQSSIFHAKVLFSNFAKKMNFKSSKVRPMNLWPKKTFSLKSSICELWLKIFRSAKVRFSTQKFYLRTLTGKRTLKSSKVRKKNF